MSMYRKKPVIIEAREWDGTATGATPIIEWALLYDTAIRYRCGDDYEFYPCKPDIFAATYEPA